MRFTLLWMSVVLTVLGTIRAAELNVIGVAILFGAFALFTGEMRRLRIGVGTLLLLASLLLASSAHGAGNFLILDFLRGSYPGQNPILPGNNMTFKIETEGQPDFVFNFPVPEYPLSQCCLASYPTPILENDAAGYGLDWAGLEAALVGNEPKTVHWETSGYPVSMPLTFMGGYLGAADLTRVQVTFGPTNRSSWQWAALTLTGNVAVLAPEPTAFALCLLGLHGFVMVRRR